MQLTQEQTALIQWGVCLGASLAAALWDLKSRRIPNVLTLPLYAAGLLQAVMFSGWDSLGGAILASVILALPYIVLFLFGGGGAGDAKLMGAIGAWLGLEHVLSVLLCVSLFGIAIALLKAVFKRRFFAVLGNIRLLLFSFMVFAGSRGRVNTVADTAEAIEGERMTVPYGPAIFAGVLSAAAYAFVVRNS